MRYVPTMIFAVMSAFGLIALPAASNAAPRTIDDCEKIQAADAYNQCLAVFGPVARGHGAAAATDQDESASADDAKTGRVASVSPGRRYAHAHQHSHHHASRHAFAKHGHGTHAKAAAHHHGHSKRLAFNVVSGHTRLR